MSDPKYPHITVPLVGEDGNAFAILARVTRALRVGGVPAAEIAEFQAAAKSGDYDHLLRVVLETVNADGIDDDTDDEDDQ